MAKTIRQKRKGISSVVGAVFMILVMVGALNVMIWTMQQQDRVTETIIEKSNSNLNKLNEDIDISNIRIDSDKLNMTVTNAGGAAATIKSIYVVNETANEQYRYDLDLVVDGRESLNIDGQDVPLIVKDDTRYSIRLITESGNTVATSLTPLSSVALPMSLYLIPPTFTPGENVTVLYAVTNNLTDSDLAGEVELDLHYAVDCSPLGTTACDVTMHVQPPSNFTTIAQGSTALFKWVFEVQMPDEDYITFNASLANAKPGNYVIEKGLSKLVDASKTSFTSEIIISSNLIQRPEIFVLLPNPFGDSAADKGLWGVIVANPTEGTMDVSRVVVNVYSSRSTGGGGGGAQEMIDASTCAPEPIYPSSGWSCPHDNTFEWEDIDDPVGIPEFEAVSFMTKLKPGDIGQDESAMMISIAVFTTMGQFTKTGYSAGMGASGLPLASVYLTDTTTESVALDEDHIFGNYSNFEPSVPALFNVTVADFDDCGTCSSTYIDSDTKLIVNVPRGFTGVDLESWTGFVSDPEVIPYSDGSHQIIATLSQRVGDVNNSAEAKILSFWATPPSVDPAGKRIYVMHALLHGTTNGGFSAGALGEFAIQVNE